MARARADVLGKPVLAGTALDAIAATADAAD